jgi:hypothetical protein
MPFFTLEQQSLIDQCIKKIQTTGDIGKDPNNNNLPLGKAVIDKVIIPLNSALTSSEDRNQFMESNIKSFSTDQLFEITRVMMKAYEEASDKDALRSSGALIGHLYRDLARRLNFSPEDLKHPAQMTELHKIEFQSLLLTRPAGTLKAAANAICFTLDGKIASDAAVKNLENAGIATKSVVAAPVKNTKADKHRPPPITITNNFQATIRTATPSESSSPRTPKLPDSPPSKSGASPRLFSKKAEQLSPAAKQVTVDKINKAGTNVLELDKLAQQAQQNFSEAVEKYRVAMNKIDSSTTPKPEKNSAYLDALSSAKEASQNSSFGATIYQKLQDIEPTNAHTHKLSVNHNRKQIEIWAEKAGELLQKAMKSGIPLNSPETSSTARRTR